MLLILQLHTFYEKSWKHNYLLNSKKVNFNNFLMFILVLWDHGFDFAINQENKEMKVIAAKIIIFYLLMPIKFIVSSHL